MSDVLIALSIDQKNPTQKLYSFSSFSSLDVTISATVNSANDPWLCTRVEVKVRELC